MDEEPQFVAIRTIEYYVKREINEEDATLALTNLGVDRNVVRRSLRDLDSGAKSQSQVLQSMGY